MATIHSALEVKFIYSEIGVDPSVINLPDRDYASPHIGWLTGSLFDWLHNHLFQHNLTSWNRKWDCDNFARGLPYFAEAAHKTTAVDTEGISVFEFWYQMDKGGGHAIVTALDGSTPVFIEPQPEARERIVQLSKKEIESCMFMR